MPEESKRRYSRGDFSPLEQHYKERIFQVHVMNEYARLGLEKIQQAINLVSAYFTMDRTSFVQRYFSGRKRSSTGQPVRRPIIALLITLQIRYRSAS